MANLANCSSPYPESLCRCSGQVGNNPKATCANVIDCSGRTGQSNTAHTLEAVMMAVPSRLGLASRNRGSESAALEKGRVWRGFGRKLIRDKRNASKVNLRKKLTYSAR